MKKLTLLFCLVLAVMVLGACAPDTSELEQAVVQAEAEIAEAAETVEALAAVATSAAEPTAPTEVEPTADVNGTVEAAVAGTIEALPTVTPRPTNTPMPPEEVVVEVEVEVTRIVQIEGDITVTKVVEVEEIVVTQVVDEIEVTRIVEVDEGSDETFLVLTTLEDGSTLAQHPTANFSMILPESYLVLDPANNEGLELVEESIRDAFVLDDQMESFAAFGIRLYGLSLDKESIASGLGATVNVVNQELPIDFTFEEYVEINQEQLSTLFDLTSELKVSELEFDGVPVARFAYTANVPTMFGTNQEMNLTQYILMNPDDLRQTYVVTVSMPVDLFDQFGEEGQEMAETFRLLFWSGGSE